MNQDMDIGTHPTSTLTNPGNRKQLATYWKTWPDGTRELTKGLVVGKFANTEGRIYIAIDNFANRVFLSNVETIVILKETW